MTHDEIREAVHAEEKAHRQAEQVYMSEYRGYYARLKELRDACEAIGHKWSFTHLGPLNTWFACDICKATKGKIEPEGNT